MRFASKKFLSFLFLFCLGIFSAIALASCSTRISQDYQATATTTLTWQVYYSIDPHERKDGRYEEFTTNSLTIRNGEKPIAAKSGPDDRGLWWPAIPPKPSLDEIEARAKINEKFDRAELLRTVEYRVTFETDTETRNLPTNYSVYRQVVKAKPENKQLRFILGINNDSVEKAEPIEPQ